jgi:hypothetical protein
LLPVRVLRAAQFHEFVAQLVEWGRRGEVSYVPNMRTQLVAARTVAQAVCELATDPESAPGSSDEPIPEISPVRARKASLTWRDCSRPGAATGCGSRG